jgi:muramidase (phage lysozyme)
MSELRQRYEQLLQRPEVRSLLNTIRYAEGTPGESGYQTMFGGGKFDTSKGWRHPDKAITGGGYTSTAAGAYQFLTPTWQGTAKALGLPGFDPKSQDLAALYLIDKKRGALDPFLKGEKFGTVLNKLAPEWASLPTSSGGSYYGQPSKKLGDLYNYYTQQKQKLGESASSQTQPQTTSTVAQGQQPTGQPGIPNINIFVTGKGKATAEQTTNPLDFLMKFTSGARARQSSSLPNPLELAQALVTTEPVNYFKM